MIDAILHLTATAQLPAALTDENGKALLSDPQAKNLVGDHMHYVRMTPAQLDEWRPHVTVLAEATYTGTGTADRVYAQIQGSGDKMAIYSSVYNLDPVTRIDEDGNEYVTQPPFKFGMLAESALPVPSKITPRQARLVLAKRGLLNGVADAIALIDDESQRQIAEIEWEYATTIERSAPWVNFLYSALGLSAADVDALFIEASGL